MLLVAGRGCRWTLAKRVVWSVHQRILTEHGSHFDIQCLRVCEEGNQNWDVTVEDQTWGSLMVWRGMLG